MRLTLSAMGAAAVIVGLHSGNALLSLAALCGACGVALLSSPPGNIGGRADAPGHP